MPKQRASSWRIEAAAAGMQAAFAILVVAAIVVLGWGNEVGRIIDGDTFVTVLGEHIRPISFDAPETYRPSCLLEERQGKPATARLRAVLDAARDVRVERSGKYDWDWRTLALVFIDGRGLADIAMTGGWGLPEKPEGGWCRRLQPRPHP